MVTVKQVLDCLQCPVEMTPLSHAVTLVPCGHSMNSNTAVRLFGRATASICHNPDNNSCAVCRTRITGYVPNYTIKEIVALLNGAESLTSETPPATTNSNTTTRRSSSLFKIRPFLFKTGELLLDSSIAFLTPYNVSLLLSVGNPLSFGIFIATTLLTHIMVRNVLLQFGRWAADCMTLDIEKFYSELSDLQTVAILTTTAIVGILITRRFFDILYYPLREMISFNTTGLALMSLKSMTIWVLSVEGISLLACALFNSIYTSLFTSPIPRANAS